MRIESSESVLKRSKREKNALRARRSPSFPGQSGTRSRSALENDIRRDCGNDRWSPGGGGKRPHRGSLWRAIGEARRKRKQKQAKRRPRSKQRVEEEDEVKLKKKAIRFICPRAGSLRALSGLFKHPGTRPRSCACQCARERTAQGSLEPTTGGSRCCLFFPLLLRAPLSKSGDSDSTSASIFFFPPSPGASWRHRRRRPSCRRWRGPRGRARGGPRPWWRRC